MSEPVIRREQEQRKGRYAAVIDGVAGEAELMFTIRGSQLISADHTEAPTTMRGTDMSQNQDEERQRYSNMRHDELAMYCMAETNERRHR